MRKKENQSSIVVVDKVKKDVVTNVAIPNEENRRNTRVLTPTL